MLKIAFGMIVFNGDFVLKECLESIYPFASQILIAEGPVKYWQDKGYKTSSDRTNQILDNFPDPEKKIVIIHGQFSEKDEQCNAYMPYMKDDIDYLWQVDSDEVYKSEDILKITKILESEQPTSVGVESCSFYGGFERYIGGFELQRDNFMRIFKVFPGSRWAGHRPPRMLHTQKYAHITPKHISSDKLFNRTGARMYHYSYVFPDQVYNKINYYKSKVSLDKCIDNYFIRVYLPWCDFPHGRMAIEMEFRGVHEFKPEYRGDSFTIGFLHEHPESIKKNMKQLQEEFDKQLKFWMDNDR